MNSAFGVDHGDEVSKAGNPMLGKIGHFTQTAGKTGGKHRMGNPTNLGRESASARRATAAGNRARFSGAGPAANGGPGNPTAGRLRPMLDRGKSRVSGMSDRAKVGSVAAGAAGLGATGGTIYSNKVKKSAFFSEEEISKALAAPMPKMARLTKPKAAGMAKPAGAQNPMLRQVNRLTQGQSAPMGNRPMGGIQQRMGQRSTNVRNNIGKPRTQGLRQRLGGQR